MWVARNKDGSLELFEGKPTRMDESTKNSIGKECFRDGFWCYFCIYSYCGKNTVQHFSSKMLDRNLFPELKWEDEPKEVFLTSFDELVEKLCPPKHDGKTFGLETEMLIAKLKYKEEHPFNSYEEEKQWMIDYLKEHWNK